MKGRAALALTALAAGTLASTAANAPAANPALRCPNLAAAADRREPYVQLRQQADRRLAPEARDVRRDAGGSTSWRSGAGQADGSIGTKLAWWTWRSRRPRVSGRRLDGPARPLHADVSTLSTEFTASGVVRFFPSGIDFPSPGCWRITTRAGSAKLLAIVKVLEQ
jgi:hypothetical protein